MLPRCLASSGAAIWGLRIEILEALTVILTVLTWGPSFAGKKVLFRSDNSGAVHCLNAMKSKCLGPPAR
jgi:hypothetical protein